jgi:hypothetical protein
MSIRLGAGMHSLSLSPDTVRELHSMLSIVPDYGLFVRRQNVRELDREG